MHLEALLGQVQGGGHTGQAGADNQSALVHGESFPVEGKGRDDPGNGTPSQILGLFGGLFRLLLVDPGALLPDVGELKQVWVQTGLLNGFLEKRLVGARGAGAYHDPVDLLLLDHLLDDLL